MMRAQPAHVHTEFKTEFRCPHSEVFVSVEPDTVTVSLIAEFGSSSSGTSRCSTHPCRSMSATACASTSRSSRTTSAQCPCDTTSTRRNVESAARARRIGSRP